MKPTLAALGASAILFGGVDASSLRETPVQRLEQVAGYEIRAEQKGNTVETTFPWKDQAGFKVKVDLGEPTAEEKLKDKRKKEVITETVTDFDGGFKVDILLNEKPDTNRFCYTIEGHENYDFFYQPPLTEQEKAEGASRPPEIEGSYAVYHKTLKNHEIGKENYATGKVMHIPRPQVWSMSDVDTKVWADMSYDAGQLCVTVPQDFLNGAEYPVRVDPTFGYTTIGGTSGNLSASVFLGSNAITPPVNSSVVSISAYASYASTNSYKGVLVASSTLNLVTNGVGAVVSFSTLGWQTSSYTTYPVVTAGTYYFVGVIGNFSNSTYYYDVLGISSCADTTNSYATPANLGACTYQASVPSLYATYATQLPYLQTVAASAITAQSAQLNGTTTTTGTSTMTQHGFVYGTNALLSGGDTATTTLGTGATGTVSQVVSLRHETLYYFRFYGTNSAGTSFGDILSFTTIANPRARLNNGTLRINNGGLDL